MTESFELLKEGKAVIMRTVTFADIKKAIEEVYKEGAKVILYDTGKGCGKRSCLRLMDKYKNKQELLDAIARHKREERWGDLTFNIDLEKGTGNIIVVDSFEAKDYGTSEEPVCHFFRGYLAGVLTQIFAKDITVIEVQCIAKKDSICKFEIVGGK